MLLTKKNKFFIEEGQIKEELTDSNGIVLVKINIKYPEIKCGKRDKMSVFAKGFYKDMAEAFKKSALDELLPAAQHAYAGNPDEFVPFAAVMKYEMTFESKVFLSVMQDITVSDGKSNLINKKKTQVWEREYGTKCKLSYFLNKKEISELIKEHFADKKGFDKELFVMREDGYEFFIRQGDEYISDVIKITQKI